MYYSNSILIYFDNTFLILNVTIKLLILCTFILTPYPIG